MPQPVEVILQDFDGTRTIYPVEMPAEVIHYIHTDSGIPEPKVYVRTADHDESGRPVYVEQV